MKKNSHDHRSIRVDLHSHTTCSDGALSPQELVFRASNFQIEQLAITDHDTISAYPIAKSYIEEQQLALRLISGIEISTMWNNFEIHIVGLNVDVDNPSLLALIAQQQHAREQRAVLMANKLAKAGFADCDIHAKQYAQGGTITRAHFARVLLERGAVSSMQKAFDKYIGKGQRAYVKPLWCDIAKAVATIHAAGGKAVIAHPMKYDLSTKWLRRLIVDFKDVNGDAMEVASPQMNDQQRQLLLQLCNEYQLQASVGSDFHAPGRWTELGRHLQLDSEVPRVWQHWN
ncbi:RNase RNM [Thalassotalea maritima]|uniref:RNase RNM n=1 Tax=Thalassotalea maritima TaxID=3242416 RepID=UPI0035291FAD